jgi:hypothetical protein
VHLERMTNHAEPAQSVVVHVERVSDRYELHEVLGRGGMASVYRATDLSNGRQVALKQLTIAATAPEHAHVAALFEREFHTLAQLRHPRVIAVYDYGLNGELGPYYTMELLDGGDLRDRAPLPWREVCALLFDVCSSLALLHSRRLLHRDVSPRNVRCTHDGKAKLIDFGAMAPMSAGGAQIVGTPAFTPPETLHRLALDARADLYSLGATLYYALTGQLPYPARTFAEVLSAWNTQVVPPSARVADIPAALDDLVLSLISLEPASRPKSAFDVMQRLAAIAELACTESDDVSRAYLSTPTLVGRSELLATLRQKLTASRAAQGPGVLITGAAGVGRSRLLDACVLEAKTLGLTVLRATASGTREPFAIARRLTQHLLDALPSADFDRDFPLLFAPSAVAASTRDDAAPARLTLRSFSDPTLNAEQLQQAICRFLLTVSRTHPLLVAVDDLHRIDQASAAVLAALVDKARRGNVFVALTADREETANEALDVLARRCDTLTLEPLTREQTHQLFGSLFGDVANLDMLSREIYEIARGNPRQCMDLAQHLVDKRLLRYAAGTWTLPSRLSADDLPRSAADAIRARIASLSPRARFLAESQALAFYEPFTDHDYRALLPDANRQELDAALTELMSMQVLVADGPVYTLANRVWTAALTSGLDEQALQRRHCALAESYKDTSNIAWTHHLFAAGRHEDGLHAMALRHREWAKGFDHKTVLEQNISKLVWCYPIAIDSAQRLGRSAREINELRRWYFAGTLVTSAIEGRPSAQLWFARIEQDSGLALWRQYADVTDPGERLTRALQDAHQHYLATPEHERVYAVDEAIRILAEYVVYSIAIGSRTHDVTLLASLPGMLEPFAGLSPVLDAIWNNAMAARDSQCGGQYELARSRWTAVLQKLDAMTGTEMQHIEAISNAVAYAVGLMEAQLGLASATSWAARLDQDPFQKISALNLRKIVRLEQGDWNGADRLRRQAEVLSLQQRSPQMFNTLLPVELAAYVKARDLAGIQNVIEHLKPLAAAHRGWLPDLMCAQASFHLVRGDLTAAETGFQQCIALTKPTDDTLQVGLAMWVAAEAGLAETFLCLDRAAAARAAASSALGICEARQVGSAAYDLVRVLALAEAKLGDARAAERLESLIARQLQLGVTGLRLGLSYEARAQIALWSGDAGAFEQYARLTAREYRYGAHCPLAARYERLVNEAGRRGLHANATLSEFVSLAQASDVLTSDDVPRTVMRSVGGMRRAGQRADAALKLICDARGCAAGHLYLMSSKSLVLSASHGAPAPPTELLGLVREYLSHEQSSADTLTVMATSHLLEGAPDLSSALIAGVRYEFVLLTCVVGAEGKVAGVAALVVGAARARSSKQGQLFSALATQLLQTGDPVD